ncbi:hypothetical protein B0H14DRAFT_3438776 [Mycena olivaceomarginata]|nr:hypothetical protein B0H14DRAFT_3438776 [Mycena olivaceomarginata]
MSQHQREREHSALAHYRRSEEAARAHARGGGAAIAWEQQREERERNDDPDVQVREVGGGERERYASPVSCLVGAHGDEVADFTSITSTDGVCFEDGERVEWAMCAIMRGLKEENAGGCTRCRGNTEASDPSPRRSSSSSRGHWSSPSRQAFAMSSNTNVKITRWTSFVDLEAITWVRIGYW